MVERPDVDGTQTELAVVKEQLEGLRQALTDQSIHHAQTIIRLRERIARVQASAQADPTPRFRGRAAHQQRAAHRLAQLTELRAQERQLLDHTPDPEAVLRHADQLRDHQQQLMLRDRHLHQQAITEELERDPPWLQQTLGVEPTQPDLKARWRRTACEIAAHRIDHNITDPTQPSVTDRDHTLARAINDTRLHLGLEHPPTGQDHGVERE